MEPLSIQVHPSDNVAMVVNAGGLAEGTVFASGLRLVEAIPQAHKVALYNLAAGDAVIRYGAVIGHATQPIPAGAWVREDRLSLPDAPRLDALPRARAEHAPLAPLEGYTFEGYRNPDGTVGTRNLLAITTTVQCVAPTVEYAVERIRRELLPHFPNVDDVLAFTHGYGCGVAINVADAAIPIRTVRHLSENPNVAPEPLVVSLGCEKMQPQRVYPDLSILSDEPWVVRLQDETHHGFGDMVAAILTLAEKRLERLNQRARTTCPASDLIVGLQCGGSDAFSGITANPAVGFAADLLVRAGATVLFSEVTEVRDAIHLLLPRAADDDVADALIREMAWYDEYLRRGSADRSANTTPGNKRGGLNNIVEKALGSVAKAGTSPIRAVTGPGERVRAKGLVFAATPASDFVCGTLQAAAGMNLHVFTTGEGTPYGLAAVPVIKVASRTELARRWPDLIDVDAGRIATGAATIEQVGWELFRLCLDVASGRHQPWAEKWRLRNDLVLFNPGPVT